MTRVTAASLAYVATQVRIVPLIWAMTECVLQVCFALMSSSVFCRSDTATDSERFYETVLEFLDDPDEKGKVLNLLDWWNW